MTSRTRAWYGTRRERTSSGSAVSEAEVKPTRSQKRTETTFRCSRTSASVSDAPQKGQNGNSPGSSCPQDVHVGKAGLVVRLDLRDDAEARRSHRQLEELRVHAAELIGLRVVAARDLDLAHRQRLPRRADGAEAAALLRGEQEVEVDLDVEDLLHAADVGVPDFLERVQKRAVLLHAGAGMNHLVAVDVAAAAADLVLWPKWELSRRRGLSLVCHVGIVRAGHRAPQDLTNTVLRGCPATVKLTQAT